MIRANLHSSFVQQNDSRIETREEKSFVSRTRNPNVSSLCRSILLWLVMKNVHLLTQMINDLTRLAAPVIYSCVIHCFHGCINIHCSRSQTKRWKINREILFPRRRLNVKLEIDIGTLLLNYSQYYYYYYFL